MTHVEKLENMGACREAVEWAREFRSMMEAWRACERGDWMLWYIGRLSGKPESVSRRRLVLCSCKCARLGLPYVPQGEKRPLVAIQTAERWAHGEGGVSLEDVRAAADAAAYAASAASAADAAYAAASAADAAAYAASAASAAAYAAYAAASAAYAAANAAAYAAYAAARLRVLSECADLVREAYPTPPRMR